jgi:ankyrin repeat protein
MAVYWKLVEAAVIDQDMFEVARLVQEHGIDVNCRESNRTTVLHLTAACGMMGMIEHLVALGADINARNYLQMTPLHIVLSPDVTDLMVECIMDYRCPLLSKTCRSKILDLNETMDTSAGLDGRTKSIILEWSEDLKLRVMAQVEMKKIELIDCLCKLGADVNAKFDVGVTSLNEAIRVGNVRAVKALAKLGLLGTDELRQVLVTALFQAVEQGQKEVMKHLVHLGADVNATFSLFPALLAAVKSGSVEMVQTLLEHGANIKCVGHSNLTPVIHAIGKNPSDFGIITCLVHLGADLNIPGFTFDAVSEALALKKPDVLNCLLQHCTDIEVSHVSHACTRDAAPPILCSLQINFETSLLEHLVQCGADINVRYDPAVSWMQQAVRKGNPEIVEALVGHGLSVDRRHIFKVGLTILCHLIIFWENFIKGYTCKPKLRASMLMQAIEVLIRLGADTNVRYNDYPVLHDAVARGDADTVRALVRLGADVNQHEFRGLPILSYLLTAGPRAELTPEDKFKTLVEHGADLNIVPDLVCPVHIAVDHSDTKMVKTLSSVGANMNEMMSEGGTILEAVTNLAYSLDYVDYLRKHGLNVNNESMLAIDPLLQALQIGDAKMVACLLECGAGETVGDGYCRSTAMFQAVASNNNDMVNYLIAAGVRVNTRVVFGDVPPLNEEASNIANAFGLAIQKFPDISYSIAFFVKHNYLSTDILETLLTNGANKSCARNLERILHSDLFGHVEEDVEVSSNLHVACSAGNLDVVRMLIIDGSDVNDHDSSGRLPFELLPLASSIDYHTLNEAKSTEQVIEMVGHDFSPTLPSQTMESVLRTPGLGDVKSINVLDCGEIHDAVYRAVRKIGESSKLYSTVVRCGSAGEGAKVGLPDEADFLAVTNQLGPTRQTHLEGAGYDYVYYSDQTDSKFEHGSKSFHEYFMTNTCDKRTNLEIHSKHGDLFYRSVDRNLFAIRDTNRKATTPVNMKWLLANGKEQLNISVDIVPSVHVKNNWPEGGIQRTWLLSHEELREHGYYLVPKPPHASCDLAKQYSPEELPTLWKISFPHLETLHMQRLEKRVKDVYLLAKCVRNPDVCRIMVTDKGSYPKNPDKYVTSYMLKMIFFKNVEYFLHSNLSLCEMVCQVYDQVEEGLSKGFIPLYFMPKVSALGGHKLNIPKSARVARILKKFVRAVYLRDSRHDIHQIDDVKEIICYQRKPKSVYRCIEIAQPEEIPETKLWNCV